LVRFATAAMIPLPRRGARAGRRRPACRPSKVLVPVREPLQGLLERVDARSGGGPGGPRPGRCAAGRMQRVKPICARLADPQARLSAPRTSPPRPTSPKSTVWRGQGAVAEGRRHGRGHAEVGRRLLHLEARPPRSRDVVAEELEADSLLQHGEEQARAVGIDAERHAAAACRRGRRDEAWISTSTGREPSIVHTTAEPGAPACRSERKRAEGFATGLRPAPVISKTPSSETAAEAVLHAPARSGGAAASRPRSRGRCPRCALGLGSGDATVLRHVTDEERRDPAALGEEEKLGSPPRAPG